MLDVVRNLLSNAIKYGGRDRTIDVSLKLDTFWIWTGRCGFQRYRLRLRHR